MSNPWDDPSYAEDFCLDDCFVWQKSMNKYWTLVVLYKLEKLGVLNFTIEDVSKLEVYLPIRDGWREISFWVTTLTEQKHISIRIHRLDNAEYSFFHFRKKFIDVFKAHKLLKENYHE